MQVLTELELPHLYHSVARNSPKRPLLTEKWGSFQVGSLELYPDAKAFRLSLWSYPDQRACLVRVGGPRSVIAWQYLYSISAADEKGCQLSRATALQCSFAMQPFSWSVVFCRCLTLRIPTQAQRCLRAPRSSSI